MKGKIRSDLWERKSGWSKEEILNLEYLFIWYILIVCLLYLSFFGCCWVNNIMY